MTERRILPKKFYCRDTATVARDLLGKKLIRRLDDNLLTGILVETEAYYGLEDPASRAFHGLKNYNKLMWEKPGLVFIYNVHKYWMLNIVAHKFGEIGAVLIRAIEPKIGIETMLKNRAAKNIYDLTSGPGKLTTALGIDKRQQGINVTSDSSDLLLVNEASDFQIGESNRIGVRNDLEVKLRFFIKENSFVSK